MKRITWITVAALVLAALFTIPAIAQPPQGRGGRGFGPGGPGGRGGPFPILRGLNLTDAQREQIAALTEHRRGGGNPPQAKVAGLQRQLQMAIVAEAPDPHKLEELKAAITAATAEELAARIDLETQVAQILTPEQRAQAREALAKTGPPNGRR